MSDEDGRVFPTPEQLDNQGYIGRLRSRIESLESQLAARQPSSEHTNDADESCVMAPTHSGACVYPSDGRGRGEDE